MVQSAPGAAQRAQHPQASTSTGEVLPEKISFELWPGHGFQGAKLEKPYIRMKSVLPCVKLRKYIAGKLEEVGHPRGAEARLSLHCNGVQLSEIWTVGEVYERIWRVQWGSQPARQNMVINYVLV